MISLLPGLETFILCDETKFSLNDGDAEDAIYYFGVAIERSKVSDINRQLEEIKLRYRIKTHTLHASTLFRGDRDRTEIMTALTRLIIDNKLLCFCYRYDRALFFESTKVLSKFNNEILNFNKAEFQAVFYFVSMLNTFLKEEQPQLLKSGIMLFFDRNYYGKKEIESFNFPSEKFIISQMTFCARSDISLLALPDFVGYMFRKSKIAFNKLPTEEPNEDRLTNSNKYNNLADISRAGLFHFMSNNELRVTQAIESLAND